MFTQKLNIDKNAYMSDLEMTLKDCMVRIEYIVYRMEVCAGSPSRLI